MGVDAGEVDVARPVLQALLLTDDGHVLVQIVDEVGEDGSTFDVFDPDGVYLGSLTMPFAASRHARHSIRGDTLAAVTTGSNDEPLVVRAVVSRRADAD